MHLHRHASTSPINKITTQYYLSVLSFAKVSLASSICFDKVWMMALGNRKEGMIDKILQ